MIKGEKELSNFLKGLPKQLDEKAFTKVSVKAAEPLVIRMHRLAPVGLTGNLADSIGIVKVKGDVHVGPRRKGGFKGFAGHLNEFGTKRRRVKKRHPIFGLDRGKMPKNPFVEPSWEQTNEQVLDNMKKGLGKIIVDYGHRVL